MVVDQLLEVIVPVAGVLDLVKQEYSRLALGMDELVVEAQEFRK